MFHAPKNPNARRNSDKQRSRASIACAGCRARRTRCIIGEGQNECDRCRRNGRPCVIRDDDERRRPVTKAKVESLLRRIRTLENTINASGIILPSAVDGHQPVQPLDARELPPHVSPSRTVSTLSSWSPHEDGHALKAHEYPPIAQTTPPQEPAGLAQRLHVNCSSSTGRRSASGVKSRYFGITTNYHIYYDDQHSCATSMNSNAQNQRAHTFLATISREAHEYLMEVFWTCHNTVIPVVHREAFERDRVSCGDAYYSGFLHICMLALGFRYADKSRQVLQRWTSPSRVSRLHHEAKTLVEYELNLPGGIPSIQALLLLADLECGVGSNNTGWLYAGMATRICFDLGLNRDPVQPGTSDLECQVRRTILWGAVILDRYWGLFLGRPASIKLADLTISHKDQPMYRCFPMGHDYTLETEIYESLIGLMEIASRLTESEHCEYSASDSSAYYFAAGMDSELQEWNSNLSPRLKWDPEKLKTAPASYFILHQQYHTLFILLYRPFVIEFASSDSHVLGPDTTQQITRRRCLGHATEIAKLVAAYGLRFDIRQQFVTGTQHAATAALALVESMPTVSPREQADILLHLQCLAEALNAKAMSYFPAKVMAELIFTVIGEYRANRGQIAPKPGLNGRESGATGTESQYEAQSVSHDFSKERSASRCTSLQVFAMEAVDAQSTGSQWVEGQAPMDPMLQDGFDAEWQDIMDILSGSIAAEC